MVSMSGCGETNRIWGSLLRSRWRDLAKVGCGSRRRQRGVSGANMLSQLGSREPRCLQRRLLKGSWKRQIRTGVSNAAGLLHACIPLDRLSLVNRAGLGRITTRHPVFLLQAVIGHSFLCRGDSRLALPCALVFCTSSSRRVNALQWAAWRSELFLLRTCIMGFKPLTHKGFLEAKSSCAASDEVWLSNRGQHALVKFLHPGESSDSFREIKGMGVVVWRMGRRVDFPLCHLILQHHGVSEDSAYYWVFLLSTEYGAKSWREQRGWRGLWLSFWRSLGKKAITSAGKVAIRIACGVALFPVACENTGFI